MMRLHPEHGLNPTMPCCFWCEKETGEIILLGAAYHGEAPHKMFLNYEPCSDCKATFEKGIALIEASEKPLAPGHKPIQERPVTLYPTGRYMVVEEKAIIDIFSDTPMFGEMMRHRRAFVEQALFDTLLPKEEPTS